MQSVNGFVKLHRKLLQWGWYKDHVVKDLFLHLLLTANFEDTEWQGITLHPGDLVTSYKSLSDDLGFSEQQIRTALKKLKTTQEITCKSTNKYTVVTVVNWGNYQFVDYYVNTQSNIPITNEQQTNNKQITTDKEYKNIRNKELSRDNNIACACEKFPDISHLSVVSQKMIREYWANGIPLPEEFQDLIGGKE